MKITRQGVVNLAGSVNGKKPGPRYCWHQWDRVFDEKLSMTVRKCHKCEFQDLNLGRMR